MPPPTLLEWCTTSISSMIQQSVHDILNKYTKSGLQVPEQILDIQKLDGQKPAEKWRCFNGIVNTIVDRVKSGQQDLDSQLSSIAPSLLNLVKVNVAVKLHLSDLIVESLKSNDPTISRKALTAHWFFDGTNPNVTADHFVKDILPVVSVRTRLDIVKRLARGLRGHELKARQMFLELLDNYSIEQCLPILIDCSADFIFESILRYKIVLSVKLLNILYARCPDLAVRYLRLCDQKNAQVHEIRIHDYDAFLPTLVRRHPRDFVELYQLTPEKLLATLSCRRTSLLLQNVKDLIVKRSDLLIKLLEPSVLKKKLSNEDFEMLLENYLPKDVTDFLLQDALDLLDKYFGKEKLHVLQIKFEKAYSQSLLDYARKLIESDSTGKSTSLALKFLRKLPSSEREKQVKLLLNSVRDEGRQLRDVLVGYLPTGESLPYLKDKISKSSSLDERLLSMDLMLVSCAVENNKSALLDILKLLRDRMKNEANVFFCRFVERLSSEFDLNSLEDSAWLVLRDMIRNARVRKQLFKSRVTLVESLLEAMMRHSMLRKSRDERYVEEAIDMLVECKISNFAPSWNVLKEDAASLEKDCLERFLQLIPLKYPEEHSLWKDKNDRLSVALSLLKSIRNYNDRCAKNPAISKPINLSDYPWICRLGAEFVCGTGFRKQLIGQLIKQLSPELYEARMSESSAVREIGNGEALQLLKRRPDKVLANWLEYLNEARDKLQSSKRASLDRAREKLRARSFVAATKWYHDLPVKFIQACSADLRVAGSLSVLGILLGGDAIAKISSAFAPKHNETNAASLQLSRAALEAMKLSRAAVPVESLRVFCAGEQLANIDGVLMSLGSRLSADVALDLAVKLASEPQAWLSKCGLRLGRYVASKPQLRELLSEVWAACASDAACTRKIVARMRFEALSECPNAVNWRAMRSCLRGLRLEDKSVLQDLSQLEQLAGSEFLSDYASEYLSKVEQLFSQSLDFEWRTRCVCLLIECLDDRLSNCLSEESSRRILEKYFFDADCQQISRVTRRFAVRYYLLSAAADKFEPRINALLGILQRTCESFDVAHPKKPRHYPANYSIREFFSGLLNELCANQAATDLAVNLSIVDRLLRVFKSSLSPCQEPRSYLALNLYREYLQSVSPVDFGLRTANLIGTLVEDFSSCEPIAEIADCLADFVLAGKIFGEHKNRCGLKLSLIEGLLQGDQYYGALASIKLLNASEVSQYDERYDRVLCSLRKMCNSSIKYNLYMHLNNDLTER